MQLNPFDDYPFHQGVLPLHVPFTSDSHYNDGYWFGWYEGDRYFFCGMRMHPNNNAFDGYAGVITGGVQRNARFSRALLPNHGPLAVGPLTIEIVEPMRVQHIVLAPTDIGLSFDVTVEAVAPPFLEALAVQYRYGRLINQVSRYTGVSRVSGSATIDGEAITLDRWHGSRDHSWGIRSSMGPYVPIRGLEPDDDQNRRALRFWVPFEVEDHSGFFHGHEDRHGGILDFEGRIDWKDGRPSTALVGLEHKLNYHPGTRELASGTLVVKGADSSEHQYDFEIVGQPVHTQGFGYLRGWKDGGAPGVYRGAEFYENDRFDVSVPGALTGPEHVPQEGRFGGSEYAARVLGKEGDRGVAMVEHMVYGAYDPYGFTADR